MDVVVNAAGRVVRTEWVGGPMAPRPRSPVRSGAVAEGTLPRAVEDPLRRYFAGEVGALESIPIAPDGTPFQRSVWSALRRIAPGTTLSYSALASAIGRPTAVRAVGRANATNPIGVVVPCHRLIGRDGGLTGYGGGLYRKQWLLDHERRPQRATLPGGPLARPPSRGDGR